MSGGVAVFKGLRYGASTAGANRFRPPQPVTPWRSVRDALDYGNIAPQVPADRRRDYADLIFNDVQPGGMGEDCLVLNLWTPSPTDRGKRPVLVRFHGGGFYAGSSNSPGSDGEMLARFGDCVVVTVNHRLSAFGYLYLGETGPFADSGAAGMLDLVAALQWVSRNAEAFGGDPRRVLIFGQSGGGAKVSHMLAMPGASGLYHSAGVMSGARLVAQTREEAAEISAKLLKRLDLAGIRCASCRMFHSRRCFRRRPTSRRATGRGARRRAPSRRCSAPRSRITPSRRAPPRCPRTFR